MEFLFIFVKCLSALDTVFKRRLTAVVPRLQELLDDPSNYLEAEEVRIGPGTVYASGGCLGFLLGLTFSCGLAMSLFPEGPLFGNRPITEKLGIGLLVLLGPLLTAGLILYWLRGGEITLNRDGVAFSYRNRTVTAPWALFWVHGDAARNNQFTLVLPVNPNEAGRVKLFVDGREVDQGRAVRVKQFKFRSDFAPRITNRLGLPEIVLREIYSARLKEIGELLLQLGRVLGPITARNSR